MGVGAREAEGAHARDEPPTRIARERTRGGRHLDAGRPVDVRVARLEVEARRDRRLLQGQDCFGDTRKTGGGLGMADIGLDRADRQSTARLAVDRLQGAHLDRVAEGRARAMGLHVADVGRRHPRVGQRRAHHCFLCGTVRGRDAIAATILVDR